MGGQNESETLRIVQISCIALFIYVGLRVFSALIYRRTGFKCEHVLIANCDFSPSAQLLERNVYITHSINQYVARA